MMKKLLFLPFVLLAAAAMGQVTFEEVFSTLRRAQPTELTHANDSSGRLFTCTKDGYIRIYQPNTTPVGFKVFLNLTNKTSASGEQGLLGLAFHPKYKENGYFYVNYVAFTPNTHTVISRFKVDPNNPDKADSTSETILLTYNQPYSNHKGGKILFGGDGYLYIAAGDGGSGGDPGNRSQNLNTLLGKILRINVDSAEAGKNYSIPADNPFVGVANARPEIYAYGLRNPWRFSYDKVSGRYWIGDVGQGTVEEIDTLVRGGNYGWAIKEGNGCTNYSHVAPWSTATNVINPVYEYGRGNSDISITGGFVYRGPSAPTLVGKYIFGDYASGRIWSLELVPGGAPIVRQLGRLASLSTFGEDENGDVYALNHSTGAIYQIRDNTVPTKPTAAMRKVAIRVLPVPARSEIMVYVKNTTGCGRTINISDLSGKVIRTATLPKSEDSRQEISVKIDVSTLPEGTYVASQPCGGKARSTKFIVAR